MKGDTYSVINDIIVSLILGKPEEFMEALKMFFAGIPYQLKMEDENNFQNAFYLLISLIGIETEAEETTSDGRIDLTIKTDDYIYIIELKYDGAAREALDQINKKQYALKFQNDSRQIIKIGVNFSSDIRRIEYRIIC